MKYNLRRQFWISGFFFLTVMFVSITTKGQVTIGSKTAPLEGALLDLKEEGTTQRGLGMPRVELTDLTKLYPMFLTAAESDAVAQSHTGLVVYNVGDDPYCPTINPGLYVWDGSIWQSLGNGLTDKTALDPATGVLTDFDGYTYTTALFGGKRWMTQNLRSIHGKDGYLLSCNQTYLAHSVAFNPGYNASVANTLVGVHDKIPQGTIGTYTNRGVIISGQSYEDFIKEFGLYYPSKYGSVICPKGWHLPSHLEFKDLFINAFGGVVTLDDNDAILISNLSLSLAPLGAYTSVDGQSFSFGSNTLVSAGFNALPSGRGFSLLGFNFGELSVFATSSVHPVSSTSNWVVFTSGANSVSMGGSSSYELLPYRCVQD